MKITRRSPITGEVNVMTLAITAGQLAAWRGGELIQDAMPTLSAEEREFLVSGCTPEDWQQLWGSEEDENG